MKACRALKDPVNCPLGGSRKQRRFALRIDAETGTIRTLKPEDDVSTTPPEEMIGEDEIRQRVNELAEKISNDYADKGTIVLVGVLKGSFIFLADLSRRLSIPRTIEFIAVSSYGNSSVQSGAVRLVMDVRGNIEGKHVLIVEDIVDTGHTLHYLIGMMASHGPASIKTCALLHKVERAEIDVPVDYVGFSIRDEWVVGYGLDYAERDRTLPYIGIVHPDDRD